MADSNLQDYNAYFANLLAPVRNYGDAQVALAADKLARSRALADAQTVFQQHQALQKSLFEHQTAMDIEREKRQFQMERQREQYKTLADAQKDARAAGVETHNPDGTERTISEMERDRNAVLSEGAGRIGGELNNILSQVSNLKVAAPNLSALNAQAIQNVANDGGFLSTLKDKSKGKLLELAKQRGDSTENLLTAIKAGWYWGSQDDYQKVKDALSKEVTRLAALQRDDASLQAVGTQKALLERAGPLSQAYAKHIGQMNDVAAARFLTSPAATNGFNSGGQVQPTVSGGIDPNTDQPYAPGAGASQVVTDPWQAAALGLKGATAAPVPASQATVGVPSTVTPDPNAPQSASLSKLMNLVIAPAVSGAGSMIGRTFSGPSAPVSVPSFAGANLGPAVSQVGSGASSALNYLFGAPSQPQNLPIGNRVAQALANSANLGPRVNGAGVTSAPSTNAFRSFWAPGGIPATGQMGGPFSPTIPGSSGISAKVGIPEQDLVAMEATATHSGQLTPQQISVFRDKVNAGDPAAIAHLQELYQEFIKGRAQNLLMNSVPSGPAIGAQ